MYNLVNQLGLDDEVEGYFMTFYEYGFKNFEENTKILREVKYKLGDAMELVLNKNFYLTTFKEVSLYHL